MMQSERLITIAVHTCEKALQLKQVLEGSGISATLQNINLEHPTISSGMRVRIKESDLAKALLIIEGANSSEDSISEEALNALPQILVPVDFSLYSFEACRIAFRLAYKHNAYLVLLHTYLPAQHTASRQLSKVLTYDTNVKGFETEKQQANEMMSLFLKKLGSKIESKYISKVKIKTVIKQGIPEEVVLQESRDFKPILIIMGTRGINNKERDMVGSVTAEVLDSCRQPVLTIPEGLETVDLFSAENVLFFCNGEQTDILAIHKLHELLSGRLNNVTLAQMHGKWNDVGSGLDALLLYCKDHFPTSCFETKIIPVKECEEVCSTLEKNKHIDLIVVPNKRRSAFARLFNPGLAHRILFSADIPVMALPV